VPAAGEPKLGREGRSAPQGLRLVEESYDFLKEGVHDWKFIAKCLAGAVLIALPCIPSAYLAGKAFAEKGATIGLDQQGRAVKIPELTNPEMSDASIRRFCGDAVAKIGTYAYHDYDMRYNEWQGYFTDDGWRRYNVALVTNQVKETVTHFNQTVITQTQTPCNIIDHKVVKGRYWWLVEANASRRRKSGSIPNDETVKIKMQIVRVGFAESNELVAIDQWDE
jgi:hypothetical protein